MIDLLIAFFSGLFLFLLGYYLGHQMGRTQHIRQRLNRDRRERHRQLNTAQQALSNIWMKLRPRQVRPPMRE